MKFYRLSLALIACLSFVACNSSFDETPREDGPATFVVNQVEQSRTESRRLNSVGLPTEIMIEFETEIRDIGLDIVVPNERFLVTLDGESKEINSNFAGDLLFSHVFQVDPANPEEEFVLDLTVEALTSHRGQVSFKLHIRPWLTTSSQVVDPRFQQVEPIQASGLYDALGRSPGDQAEPYMEMIIRDISMQPTGTHYEVGHDMGLRIHKQFKADFGIRLQRLAHTTQMLTSVQIPTGRFKVSSFLMTFPGEFPVGEKVFDHVRNCLPRCLLAKDIVEAEYENDMISVLFNPVIPLDQLASFDENTLFFLVVESEDENLPLFAGYDLFLPSEKKPKVSLTKVENSVAELLLSTERATTRSARPVDITDYRPLYESNQADFLDPALFRFYELEESTLDQMLLERTPRIEKNVQVEHCTPKLYRKELKYVWGLFSYLKKVPLTKEEKALRENQNCTTEELLHILPVQYFSLVHRVDSHQLRVGDGQTSIIDLKETVLHEVRNDYEEDEEFENFIKAGGEAKLETPFPILKGAVMAQVGGELVEAYKYGYQANRRQRNSILIKNSYVLEEYAFDMTGDISHCMKFKVPGAKRASMYCKRFNNQDFSDVWYFMHPVDYSGQTVGIDARDPRNSEASFHFRGEETLKDFVILLSTLLQKFDRTHLEGWFPTQVQAVWSGYRAHVSQKLEDDMNWDPSPGMIRYDVFRPLLPIGPTKDWKISIGSENLRDAKDLILNSVGKKKPKDPFTPREMTVH